MNFQLKVKNIMKNKIYLLIITTAISGLLASCGEGKKPMMQFPPTQVTAYTVKEEKASYYDTYPATVVALDQIEIRPEVSGYLTNIYFQDGQHVTKGMKLYGIDQQQYKAAYDVAKANLEKAEQDYKRYQQLAQNNAIAQQTLEHAAADLKAAQSQLSEVETNLRNSIIYAPFSGTIGISQVKLGSAITAGQTLMNNLSSDDPMAVDFAVDESQIERYNRMLNDRRENSDSTFTLQLPDGSIYNYHGRLLLLDRAVDPQTGTLMIRLTFPNPKNYLRPGLTCNVRVLNNNFAKSVVIPFKAVTVQMGEYFVFVIHGNKVSQQKIEIGRTIEGDKVIVNSGLQSGEQIVTQGVQKLRDNSPIVLASEAGANAGTKYSGK